MKTIVIIYVILILLVVGLFFFQRNNLPFIGSKNPSITINGKTYTLILAKTQKEKEIGLSGRDKLDANTGMLFIFDTKDTYPFWMRNMRFPLDMIYMSDNKIVDIINAPVPQDPSNIATLPVYRPKTPANYVLEINAGQSKDNNFKVGDTVTLKNVK